MKAIELKVGDKCRAICYRCKDLQTTTYRVRDVPFSSGRGIVQGLLVSVCDVCDAVVGIPQQSVPKIKETVERLRHSTGEQT